MSPSLMRQTHTRSSPPVASFKYKHCQFHNLNYATISHCTSYAHSPNSVEQELKLYEINISKEGQRSNECSRDLQQQRQFGLYMEPVINYAKPTVNASIYKKNMRR